MTDDILIHGPEAWLHGQGRLRVWSLIVTFLGDAVEPRGGAAQTARIGAVLDRLGVGRAAQRTALSRLVADGWIDRARDPGDGRASVHRFSDRGRAAFGPAARLVYATPAEVTGGRWRVVRSDAPRGIPIAPGVGLWPDAFPPEDDAGFALAGQVVTVPDAMRDTALTPQQAQEAEELATLLSWIEAHDPNGPLEAMATRTVLIHCWRRYVLRHPELPDWLAPVGWAGVGVRADVARAYRGLWDMSERWLDTDGAGYAALPQADASVSRFGTMAP